MALPCMGGEAGKIAIASSDNELDGNTAREGTKLPLFFCAIFQVGRIVHLGLTSLTGGADAKK